MGGGRQAWCPRCDEVRGARAGASCPVCGRQLLAMPPARPGQHTRAALTDWGMAGVDELLRSGAAVQAD